MIFVLRVESPPACLVSSEGKIILLTGAIIVNDGREVIWRWLERSQGRKVMPQYDECSFRVFSVFRGEETCPLLFQNSAETEFVDNRRFWGDERPNSSPEEQFEGNERAIASGE
jgi:hypothetical protein